MNSLIIEINKFLRISPYSASTISQYKGSLLMFAKEIAAISETPQEEIHLQRIYEVYDNQGEFITYRGIDAQLIDQHFYSNLSRGYSWLRGQRNALSAFFKFLNRNYDFKNIMLDITFELKLYKPKTKQVRSLSKHEALKFFHTLVHTSNYLDRDVLLFTLIITTGCRISEIISLKLEDINWEDNMIFLPKTKHNQSRTIPLRPNLSDCIKVYCNHYGLVQKNDTLFQLSRVEIRDIFYEFLAKANLPKVNLHSLRHSFATFMSESGAEITVVQQLLGHSDLFTTKDYIHSNIIKNKSVRIKENENLYKKLADLV